MSWECNCEKAVERDESFPGVYRWCPLCGRTREHVRELDDLKAEVDMLEAVHRDLLREKLAAERSALDIAVGRDDGVSLFKEGAKPPTNPIAEAFNALSAMPRAHTTWARRDGAGVPVMVVAIEDDLVAIRTAGAHHAAVHTIPASTLIRDYDQL